MSDNSPYATPNSELGVNQEVTEFNHAGIFSFSGRVGRLRYLAYLLILYLVLFCIAAMFGMIITASGGSFSSDNLAFNILLILGYLVLIIYSFAFMRRRINDIGYSGWWVLLSFIPIANIILGLFLMFKAGEPNQNQYGNPAVPNNLAIKILGFALPVMFFVGGMLAAIAIPSYERYKEKSAAKQMEMEQRQQELLQKLKESSEDRY